MYVNLRWNSCWNHKSSCWNSHYILFVSFCWIFFFTQHSTKSLQSFQPNSGDAGVIFGTIIFITSSDIQVARILFSGYIQIFTTRGKISSTYISFIKCFNVFITLALHTWMFIVLNKEAKCVLYTIQPANIFYNM